MNEIGTEHDYDLKRIGKSTIKCRVVVHGGTVKKRARTSKSVEVRIINSEPFVVNKLK